MTTDASRAITAAVNPADGTIILGEASRGCRADTKGIVARGPR